VLRWVVWSLRLGRSCCLRRILLLLGIARLEVCCRVWRPWMVYLWRGRWDGRLVGRRCIMGILWVLRRPLGLEAVVVFLRCHLACVFCCHVSRFGGETYCLEICERDIYYGSLEFSCHALTSCCMVGHQRWELSPRVVTRHGNAESLANRHVFIDALVNRVWYERMGTSPENKRSHCACVWSDVKGSPLPSH
jgi:hypothetical protein